MKAVIQRVSQANIDIKDKTVSHIKQGFFILLGIAKGDTRAQVKTLADKCAHLRIFEDNKGKFNLSILDTGGEALVASQFTLLADTSRGRRPSFINAEEPKRANELYEFFVQSLRELGIHTQTGVFGKSMDISLINHGPVTIIMEV